VYGLVVQFGLVEGCEAAFDSLMEETVAFIWACEPDTLVYACHRVAGDAHARVFYELYADEDAFHTHEQSQHVRRFLRERERYLIGPPDVRVLDLVVAKGVPGGAG
jgi:quinol monooxygenase YgiN